MTLTHGARLPANHPVAVLVLSPCFKPGAEKDRHSLRDAPLPGDPIPHRPGGDSKPDGGGHLRQGEALQCAAQLVGGHGHAAIKIGITCLCLASRHIVPRFPTWPHLKHAPGVLAIGRKVEP